MTGESRLDSRREYSCLLQSAGAGSGGWLSILLNGYQVALAPNVGRPGREAEYSPPSSTEVKNERIYASTPTPIRLHGVCKNITFTLSLRQTKILLKW